VFSEWIQSKKVKIERNFSYSDLSDFD